MSYYIICFSITIQMIVCSVCLIVILVVWVYFWFYLIRSMITKMCEKECIRASGPPISMHPVTRKSTVVETLLFKPIVTKTIIPEFIWHSFNKAQTNPVDESSVNYILGVDPLPCFTNAVAKFIHKQWRKPIYYQNSIL